MITIPLSPDQYKSALAKLLVAHSPDVDSLKLPTTTTPGRLDNSQVSFEFQYNGSNALDVTILQKHGLARFASDSTIQAHLVDLLNKLGS